MSTADIAITDTVTGERVVYHWQGAIDDRLAYERWWTAGNFSCDCNRKICFDEAKGIETDDAPCNRGLNRYTVEILWP